jgi:26S proteasome regulatory subunit N10
LAAFARLPIGGRSDLATSLQIAQLALKHRKNKTGGQRIIAFVGGPVSDSRDALMKIGKQLKKNNVAIDIISFGEIDDNNEKLSALVETTASNENRFAYLEVLKFTTIQLSSRTAI